MRCHTEYSTNSSCTDAVPDLSDIHVGRDEFYDSVCVMYEQEPTRAGNVPREGHMLTSLCAGEDMAYLDTFVVHGVSCRRETLQHGSSLPRKQA